MAISKDPTVDVLIIGGSHAGLSAALALYRALHTTIVFDSKKPRNNYSTVVHLTPTWENKTPEEMREASREELQSTGYTTFIDAEVSRLEKVQNNLFQATDSNGAVWQGRKVLFATGARDVFPDIPGYASLWAKAIYPCMFQFGFEHRSSPSAGVLAIPPLDSPPHALMLASDAHKFSHLITLYTNGNAALATQLTAALPHPDMRVDDRKIARLDSGGTDSERVVLEFEDGQKKGETFLVHRAGTVVHAGLAEGLGVKLEEGMGGLGIKVDMPFCRTNVKGVYAAGDCATPMKTIGNAVVMGAYAGCGIARELPKGG